MKNGQPPVPKEGSSESDFKCIKILRYNFMAIQIFKSDKLYVNYLTNVKAVQIMDYTDPTIDPCENFYEFRHVFKSKFKLLIE